MEFRWLPLLLLPFLPLQVCFGGELARSKAELAEMGQRIEQLVNRVAVEGESLDRITADLDRVEKRKGMLAARIRQNTRDIRDLEQEVSGLLVEKDRLDDERRLATETLGGLLRSRYLLRESGSMQMLMNQQDPHALARKMTLFRYVLDAGNRQLQYIGSLQRELEENHAALESRTGELARVRSVLAGNRRELNAEEAAYRDQLALVRRRLSESEAEIRLYRQREKALENLIRELRRPPKPVKPEGASTRRAGGGRQDTETAGAAPATTPRRDANRPATRIAGGFADNKGRLSLPLNAPLRARFGEGRSEGGLPWDGILFDSASGQEVRAIYPGQVVFSDWFRGYGQLMVLDHGEGYMSLYGHNQQLNAGVGDLVQSGQVIATAAKAGAPPAQGLYFEIRHNGSPDDPLKWCR